MRRIATAVCAGVLASTFVPATAGAAFGPAGSFGGSGSGDGQFNHPQAVAVDSSGRIYVADTGNARVQRFNAAGSFLNSYSASPNFAPLDVAIGPLGVYVASPTRIDLWSLLGVHIRSWQPAGVAYGIAVDPSGNVYVSDTQNSQIHKYNGLGGDLGSFAGAGSAPGQLLQPQGLTADGAGSVYVADPVNSRIERFDSNGAYTGEWRMPSYTVVANGTFGGSLYPHDVAVDGGGRVFAPDAGSHSNLVGVFGADGGLQQLFGSPDSDPGNPCALRAPWGLATSPSGALYVASTGEDRIRGFNEGSAACPFPYFGPGGGAGQSGTAGAVSDRAKPKVKLAGLPKGKCTRRNFAFLIKASDDVQLSRLTLYLNHRRVARQSISKAEWSVRVRIPARKVSRQIPRGSSARVLITVKVSDASGKKASASRVFSICGAG